MSIKTIPHSLATTTDDTNSMDDVIDLNQAFNNHSSSGRLTSMSTKLNHYRISLHSIDDDELKRFHRDLVTPAPSVCFEEDDDRLQHYMFRQRPITTSTSYPNRPCSRSESVMLFKKINNGDEDVSFDLVSSEFRDFLDTDFMMDDILSRPVSRTTISKNASKIQDINTFRNTVYKTSDSLLSDNKKTITRSPLLLRKRYEDNNLNTSPSSNPRLAAATTTTATAACSSLTKGEIMPMSNNSKLRPTTTTTNNKVIYEQKKPQQIPTRRLNIKRPIANKTRYNNPGEENRYRNTHHRSYSNNYVEEEAEPEIHESIFEFKPRRMRQSTYQTTVRNKYERNRSDSSSSSDDLPEELSSPLQQVKSNKYDPDFVLLDTQRSTAAFSSSNNNMLQHHRYSVPNTRIQHYNQDVKKSLSSSRLTKSNNTNREEMSVTDSAKQVLACIRERRKTNSSSIIKMEQSPKLEGRTRFISSSPSSTLSAQQQYEGTTFASDFRSRLQIHRGDYQRKSEGNKLYHHRKYDTTTSEALYENDGRLLISRLPQRTLYHR